MKVEELRHKTISPPQTSLIMHKPVSLESVGVRTELVAAQARRDRLRLVKAQAEVTKLLSRVDALENSPSRRFLEPLRRKFHDLPPGLRRAILRLLGGGEAATFGAIAYQQSAVAGPRGLALVIDDHWPQPDRDSGSVDIANLLDSLQRLGFEVVFAAAKETLQNDPAKQKLLGQGIRCIEPDDGQTIDEFIRQNAGELDLCVLCRVFCGGNFLEAIQASCHRARIVFNSIDLAFLREERRARLLGDEKALSLALWVRQREELIIRACDATIVVSQAERDMLVETIPDAYAVLMPLARPLSNSMRPFEERQGIGFIGGFAHAPNVDALRYFLAEIWPLVRRDLLDVEFTIVGSDFPIEILNGVEGKVRALGHLPDIEPWFASLRLSIAPLRFGAGAKGKVASSLANGVPCIATSIASEGMLLGGESGVLAADTPEAFAARIIEAYTTPPLWRRLSLEGLEYARHTLSIDNWRLSLDEMLLRLGL